MDLAERFWSKVDKSGECWIWTGYRDPKGYGRISVGSLTDGSRRNRLAHHVAYELETGLIPAGKVLLHRCDNPPCVRPLHLRLGTQQDNVADMVNKRRQNLGARNGRAIITDEVVVGILRRLAIGETKAAIARSVGVSRSLVSMIAAGKRWRHVAV